MAKLPSVARIANRGENFSLVDQQAERMGIALIWIILAVAVAAAASARGRSAFGWFLISAIFSPVVGLLLLIAFPNRNHERLLRALETRLSADSPSIQIPPKPTDPSAGATNPLVRPLLGIIALGVIGIALSQFGSHEPEKTSVAILTDNHQTFTDNEDRSALTPSVATSSPAQREGWWIVVGSIDIRPDNLFSDATLQAQRRIQGRVKECGFEAFNDFSTKFSGFAPGYNVLVLGPWPSKQDASGQLPTVKRCVPDAYVRQAAYAGE